MSCTRIMRGIYMTTDILTNIANRLAAVEAAVFDRAGHAPAAGVDRRLTTTQRAARRGTSTRTVDRDVERGLLPPPQHENGRCYWWLSMLQEYEARAK